MEASERVAALYPESAFDALDWWDSGRPVFTVEMGGLGPGYEQCIHITCFEAIRAARDGAIPSPPPEDCSEAEWRTWSDIANKALWASKVVSALGLSGAQAGAAKHIAGRALRMGWRAMLEDFKADPQCEADRLIQVSKSFPSAKAEASR